MIKLVGSMVAEVMEMRPKTLRQNLAFAQNKKISELVKRVAEMERRMSEVSKIEQRLTELEEKVSYHIRSFIAHDI